MSQQSVASKKSIFKSGSTTYFYSSLFFPKEIWEKVATLYAYVRTVDNFVDETPQDLEAFNKAKQDTKRAWAGKKVNDPVISDFIVLAKQHQFEFAWIAAFLNSMEMDTSKSTYQSFNQLLEYIYGSAAVIGLMMAALLGLPKKSLAAAQKQGEAMQLINFVRDIAEDCQLGRQYMPTQDLKRFGVKSLCQKPQTAEQRESFESLIRFEVDRYRALQAKAEQGYKYIPYRYRVPIATAAGLYSWTAKVIYDNPLGVFERKVKPSKARVVAMAIRVAWKWRNT